MFVVERYETRKYVFRKSNGGLYRHDVGDEEAQSRSLLEVSTVEHYGALDDSISLDNPWSSP